MESVLWVRSTLPDDEARSHVGAVSSRQLLRLREGLAGAEGQEDLCAGRHVLWGHRLQTPQETVRVSHSLQVYHPAPILHDAFAVVDFKAAGLLGARVRSEGRGRHGKAKGQLEEDVWKAHGRQRAAARSTGTTGVLLGNWRAADSMVMAAK